MSCTLFFDLKLLFENSVLNQSRFNVSLCGIMQIKQRDCMDRCLCVITVSVNVYETETYSISACVHAQVWKKRVTKKQSQSLLWKEKQRKKENVSFRPIFHIAASKKKKNIHMNWMCVCLQRWHLHWVCIHFCTQWGWPPAPRPWAPPIFSSGGVEGR